MNRNTKGQGILNQETMNGLSFLTKELNYDLLGQIVELFRQEVPPLIMELRNFVAQGDFKNASRMTHAIKSSSGCLGAHRIYELCQSIEQFPKDRNFTESITLVETLEQEYQFALQELHRKQSSHSPETGSGL